MTNNSPTFGDINFPEDKRRMIGRINITSELSHPFDTFFEYEGIVLKKKIDQGQKIILMINEKYVQFTFRTCNEIWFYKHNFAKYVSKY